MTFSPFRFALVFGALVVACNREERPKGASLAASSASASARADVSADPQRLPEDPVKAQQATEQWRQHLIEEERERRQMYDRAHEKEHEAVVAGIRKARARYEAAKSKAQVTSAQAAFRSALPGLKKAVVAIDPDRQSSNLQDDYDAILAALDAPYADALTSSFAGDDKALVALRADLDARLEKARAWLEEAEEAEREMREKSR